MATTPPRVVYLELGRLKISRHQLRDPPRLNRRVIDATDVTVDNLEISVQAARPRH